ncbi:MAG: hypothetical protein KAT15_13990, partial [Bacteroidales bacterium]|nr:hypothetical protein [Bacteroidales bacterium]
MAKLSGIILLAGCLLLALQGFAQEHPAAFVWKDPEGNGRQQTVLLRRTFELGEATRSAMLHLFADSRYHLYVNGSHVNFGPSRFYPAHPEYDSYNLAPFLGP